MQLFSRAFEELRARELYEILRARAQIFVVEQNRVCRDLDGIDDKSRHIFYEEDGKVTAYLRAFYREEGVVQMGRALPLTHGTGLGRILLQEDLLEIREKLFYRQWYCGHYHLDRHLGSERFRAMYESMQPEG